MSGNKIMPVREVAYIPGNPQCARLLPPTSSVSMDTGATTKYIPVIKNGLDYMSLTILTPKRDPNEIIPTACHVRTISPQLIHQKCGHYFQDRSIDLAKRKLIDGLPISIPSLDTPCPICMATESNHHLHRPLADYTLLKPGQQMHMD